MAAISVFHMNSDVGETSYAKNSVPQKKLLSIAKPFLEEALAEYLYKSNQVPDKMSVADLGCSWGPNVLLTISEIVNVVYDICRRRSCPCPELFVSLNDLPGNNFNNIFTSLPEFYSKLRAEKGGGFGPCMVAGVPGSFYGRLFPSKSLHFAHSSSSLHWLSQPPVGLDVNARPMLNKGNLYISSTSPEAVVQAYADQFNQDFSSFIRSRAVEMITGGRMVLSFMGRRNPDHMGDDIAYGPMELLSQALRTMITDGIVEEEMLDSFNVPYYTPCPREVIQVIEEQGSFAVWRLETIEFDWDAGYDSAGEFAVSSSSRGQWVAKTHRAVIEPMLSHYFGSGVIDELIHRYSCIVDDYLISSKYSKLVNLVLSVIRK
ncbi:putative jasmonic acid carboxyl methyltransferase 2 [Drosera capensis]